MVVLSIIYNTFKNCWKKCQRPDVGIFYLGLIFFFWYQNYDKQFDFELVYLIFMPSTAILLFAFIGYFFKRLVSMVINFENAEKLVAKIKEKYKKQTKK